ncbi:MAG: M14 family zinc carboxypeptidase [Myxococcota bacterium]
MTELLTRAEATNYRETSTHAEVLAFCDALAAESKYVQRTTIGNSGEGQDMVALVVSGQDCFTPQAAREQGKVVVMVEANIHAGEVEGKEAILAICRDLVRGKLGKLGKRILRNVCLVVIPDFNPDGNDRISPKNRVLNMAALEGQVNPPGGVGTRYTGQGWNLNRDNMKQEAIETLNLAAYYRAWWPHLFIDCHTTDGSLHAFDLTYDTSHSNPRLFAPLRGYNQAMLERVARRVEKRAGYRSFWYGNYVVEDDPTSGWHTYPALPRFGSHYRGLLGRMDVLLETYSYIDFDRRCRVIRAWLEELLRFASKRASDIIDVCGAEEQRIIARGRRSDPRDLVGVQYGVPRRDASGALSFDYPAYALDGDTAEIIAYDLPSIRARKYPGQHEVEYHAPHHRTFMPTVAVTTPAAYLAPKMLAERLIHHGVQFEELTEAREVEVDSYKVTAKEKTFSPDVAGLVPKRGEAEVPLSAKPPPQRFETVLSVSAERHTFTAPPGTLWIPTAQRAGTLAVYLLEPQSDDGFTRWEFLDGLIEVGAYHPVHRVVRAISPPKKAE